MSERKYTNMKRKTTKNQKGSKSKVTDKQFKNLTKKSPKPKLIIQKVNAKQCPRCEKIAKGANIEAVFGWRNMGDGSVRPQTYCRKCRTEHGKEMTKLKSSKKALRGKDLREKANLQGKRKRKASGKVLRKKNAKRTTKQSKTTSKRSNSKTNRNRKS